MRIYSQDVRMYVRVGHAQECQFALALRNPGVTERFLAMEDEEDSVTGFSQQSVCRTLLSPPLPFFSLLGRFHFILFAFKC